MQHLRIGSTVSLQYVDYNSSGGSTGTYDTGKVTNMTDSYIEIATGDSGRAYPWASVKRISITTD